MPRTPGLWPCGLQVRRWSVLAKAGASITHLTDLNDEPEPNEPVTPVQPTPLLPFYIYMSIQHI